MHPKVTKELYIRTLGDEKVVYDKENGRVHFLNQTATFVFDLCDGSNSEKDIVRRLIESYEVDRQTAEKDVEDVLKGLEEKNLLAESAAQ